MSVLNNSNGDSVPEAVTTDFNSVPDASPNCSINITTALYNEPVGKQYTIVNGTILGKKLLARPHDGTLHIKEFCSVEQYAD